VNRYATHNQQSRASRLMNALADKRSAEARFQKLHALVHVERKCFGTEFGEPMRRATERLFYTWLEGYLAGSRDGGAAWMVWANARVDAQIRRGYTVDGRCPMCNQWHRSGDTFRNVVSSGDVSEAEQALRAAAAKCAA